MALQIFPLEIKIYLPIKIQKGKYPPVLITIGMNLVRQTMKMFPRVMWQAKSHAVTSQELKTMPSTFPHVVLVTSSTPNFY